MGEQGLGASSQGWMGARGRGHGQAGTQTGTQLAPSVSFINV